MPALVAVVNAMLDYYVMHHKINVQYLLVKTRTVPLPTVELAFVVAVNVMLLKDYFVLLRLANVKGFLNVVTKMVIQ